MGAAEEMWFAASGLRTPCCRTPPTPTPPQGRPGQQWWPAEGYHLQRALAAAQKRSCLLPGDL